MNEIIKALNWRYATKQFDTTKKVSDSDVEMLLEAARLSASSYGLQPYHFFVIEDEATRMQLKEASWGQAQITDASHLLVLANKTTFTDSLIDDYIDNLIKTRGVAKEQLTDYIAMMKNSLLPMSEDEKKSWTGKQAYIALGNLLAAAAHSKIDACPMEGFNASKYNEILGLADKHLNAAVVLTIGYRSIEDKTQHYPKVRYSKEKLITHL